MLKENWKLISFIERFGDAVSTVLSFLVAYYSRDVFVDLISSYKLPFEFQNQGLAPIKDYFIVAVSGVFLYYVILVFLGAYQSMRMRSFFGILWQASVSSILVFIFLSALLFSIRVDLSRAFLVLFCISNTFFISSTRLLALNVLRYLRSKGRNYRNVLVIGIGEHALRITAEVMKRPELGLGIRGYAVLQDLPTKSNVYDTETVFNPELIFETKLAGLGCLKPDIVYGSHAINSFISASAIDEVFFADIPDNLKMVRDLIQEVSEQGIRTTLVADFLSIGILKSGISYFAELPLIHFQTPPGETWELYAKRIIDISLSFLSLIVASPAFLILSFLVKATSPGPVFFKQKRVGLHGRIFTLYKFRSMRIGAENELLALKEKNEMTGPLFKIKEDPRVTTFGKIIRRLSLDELPQLINVFRGDMSIVGPRPPIPGEVSMYERRDRRRLSMRPGLTCLWQVSGRNNIKDFDKIVELDLEYIDTWSLWRDFLLMARTVPVVLFGAGAS